MVKKKLVIGRDFGDEEAALLDDCKEIIDVSGRIIGSEEFGASLKGSNCIFLYIIHACWGFLRSIFNVYIDSDCHSAYVLGRALIEYYIDLNFLLKEDTEKRSQEVFNAWKEGRDPFKNNRNFGKFRTIEQRAVNVNLLKLYNASYRSLCSFSHLNLKGSLIARQTRKAITDRPKFLLHMMLLYMELLEIASKKLNLILPQELIDLMERKTSKFAKKIKDENLIRK